MDKARAGDGDGARRARLLAIGDALQAAAAAADWDRLGELARALAPTLRALAARGPWSAAEGVALQRLRGQHDAAAQALGVATDALGARLEAMYANKEGWLAYATHNETDSGASPQ
ncbi:hypothetical protein [uncultured Massilia sp.]|uniref:hypothetical protein n=1 Tax=uncultured Massilia sp. TaxID=169973 RepID=UPI0025F3D81D|nr:hypothetical protein [uncultured Massilia sp.]